MFGLYHSSWVLDYSIIVIFIYGYDVLTSFCPPSLSRKSKGPHLIYGTNKAREIFVFKVKTHTKAVDWFSKLW